MAHYLVTAVPIAGRMEELGNLLRRDAFVKIRPFGGAITHSLRNARLREDGTAVWEEEDYCVPPLAQERSAVLDAFFGDLGKGYRSRAIRSAARRDWRTQSFRAIPR